MEPLTEELITQFSVVVLTNSSLEEQLRVAAITRTHNIALIIAGTPGQNNFIIYLEMYWN